MHEAPTPPITHMHACGRGVPVMLYSAITLLSNRPTRNGHIRPVAVIERVILEACLINFGLLFFTFHRSGRKIDETDNY